MGTYTPESEGHFSNMPKAATEPTQSLLSAMNRFVHAVNIMDETVMIPSKLQDMEVSNKPMITSSPTSNKSALVPATDATSPGDLYNYYTMLNAIKCELVRGPTEDEEDENVHVDEHSRQTAAMFRHHLKGLFNVLRQLTDSANYLTGKYQEELGDGNMNNTARLSSFTL